jgi:hypothetical protein
MRTLLLDTVLWDFVLDVSGNWAVAGEPYSLAQDAASAIRLFQSELWYNASKSKGVPYFQDFLGRPPAVSLMKTKFVAAAMTVPGVVKAVCFISGVSGRRVTGQVQVTDKDGNVTTAGF